MASLRLPDGDVAITFAIHAASKDPLLVALAVLEHGPPIAPSTCFAPDQQKPGTHRSTAVQMITRLASAPLTVNSLVEKLTAEFPDSEAPAIDTAVTELIGHGVLITCLRPPSTVGDGLAYILDRLREIGAAELAEAAPLVANLQDVHARTHAAGGRTARHVARAGTATAARMQALAPLSGAPFAVDLELGCTAMLPRSVALKAESAVEALLRLSPAPTGHPGWREYHTRFLDRYGPGALVRLGQLVDPTTGLGFPRHFAHPTGPDRERAMSDRDERLLVLALQAALDGMREIVLDDDLLDTLAVAPASATGQVRHAPHVDLCVEARPSTTAALNEGAVTLAVTGVGRTGIATSGRFLDLLRHEDRDRVVADSTNRSTHRLVMLPTSSHTRSCRMHRQVRNSLERSRP